MTEKPAHMAIPPDHPLHNEYAKLQETFTFIQRVAILAVHRLGGTMRILDEEWQSADGADIQWRTMRHPNLQPELHVAVTLQGESVSVGQSVHGDKPN